MIRLKHQGNSQFREVCALCIKWLGIAHVKAAYWFLYPFRKSGEWLTKIPWNFRASIAAFIAVIILLISGLYGNSLLCMSGFTRIIAETEEEKAEEAAKAPERIDPNDEFSDTKINIDSGSHESFSPFHQLNAMRKANLESINPEHVTLKPEEMQKKYRAAFDKAELNDANLYFIPEHFEAMFSAGAFDSINRFHVFGWFIMAVLLAGIILACAAHWVKKLLKPAYYVLAAGGTIFGIYWLLLIIPMFDVPNILLQQNRQDFDSGMRNIIWFGYLWMWMPILFYSFFCWFPLYRSSAKKAFGIPVKEVEIADVWEKILLCKGENGGLMRGGWWSFSYHFIILLLIPLIMKACYFEDEYKIPKGDGNGAVQQIVQIVKPKKPKKKQKKYIFNEHSSISFAVPEMDDTRSEELDEETSKDVYEVTQLAAVGAFGAGGKGGRPGWPNGIENAKIRFIRLEYAGGDWDQDMGHGADYNMLKWISENVGLKVADDTEAIKITQLERWKKGKAPPFVYITGSRGISLNSAEAKIIRKYLLNGGMLFADNGGGYFDSSFRNLCRRVLPELQLVDIANDDPIYQMPFQFPNGAPPLFHHSGSRALGIKYNGRWLVFYHQGDINDAWKAGGSGVSKQVQERAFKMGANVIAYSFTQYLALTASANFR